VSEEFILAIAFIEFILRQMRYMAWIAFFSLQMGMFICSVGIDVCHAAGAPTQIQLSSSQHDSDQQSAPLETCAAHAAHTFLVQISLKDIQAHTHIAEAERVLALQLLDVSHLIEQPPKFLHS